MRLVVASMVMALAGLTGVVAWASTSELRPTVTCDSIIQPGGTFSWRPTRVVLGVVAIPPKHIPQTVASGSTRWPYWSKSGLVIRADSPPVFVIVPGGSLKRVAISWGNAGPASALRFTSCPPSSALGGWNPYAGGFHLRSRAACVPLTFRVGSREATVRFGVGKRCG